MVERVHSGFTKDIDHVRYPYPKLLTELKLTRGDSDDRFPVSFAYQNIFDRALDEKAVDDITLIETIEQEVTSAYTLSVMDLRDRITAKLKYRKDRFLRESIQQHLGYYRRILKAIIGEPRTIIREIALLSEKEKHQLLFEFNDTKAAYPKDKTLVELFEEQVKQMPEHIALVFEEKQWTYKQLNQTANQLGNYLKRSYRIQPDDRIGIQLERGTCLVISILGILKSGGAYVPIDLEYPQDRIDHMIQDSDCKVVMDQKELDKFQMVQQNYSKENLPVLSRPHHLAYVIYTSGSTGKPKGVMVEHRNLSNYIHYANNKYYFDNHANDNNCVLYSSLSFDLTVTSLYLPFLSGSTLHIIDQQDTNQLLKNVLTTEANLIKLTPAHIDLLDGSDLSINTSIGCVIVGGEQFTSSQLKKMRALKADLKIFNEYGPTEATVGCSVFELFPETNSISIGAPISNTQMHVIDANMQLVPIGVSGELCIAGDGLARGYLNCPELTAEKFVKNPFGKGRLYKTGDLARRLHNGNIEFLGRMDHQVKIRGYRIELGEIEAALNSYETIRNTVVIAREYEGSKQLVAYYVPKNEGEELEVPKLKSYLSKSLPEYMVPSFLVPINEIPLTPNGKTNRKALIANKLKITGNLEYVAPGTETEKQLTVIWQEVLGVEQVGIHDNFFELGGHSLNVTRLMNRIHSQLLVETNIKELFLHPVLADQATLIEKHSLSKYQSIPQAPAQASYPLSNAQRRLWVLSQFEEGNKAYNVPLVYHVQGVLDLNALTEAFKDMMKRHEILRTVFRADAEEEVRQWVLEMEALEFSIAFEDLSKEQVSPLSLKEMLVRTVSAPFNLEKSPLLRVNLFKLSQDRYVFVCVMHHIISDEWSMDIFIKELFTIYQGRISGEETLLPALPIQYKDYSLWQQDQLESGILEASRAYWLSRFKGEVPVLSLPTDRVRPRVKTYRGGLVVGKIPMEVLSSLESLLQKQGATLFMGVTALVKVLLYRYSGQEDLIVGSPVTGRDHQDLSGQIGFYLNTLALRTHIDANKGFISLLKQLKETTLAAYEHQRYPFDKLVDELDLKRDRSRSALFDVMVILANAEGLRDQKVS
ncbi:MAG: amino acid adenylation domain-containing protein, partial [Bacteroidota bacterium]